MGRLSSCTKCCFSWASKRLETSQLTSNWRFRLRVASTPVISVRCVVSVFVFSVFCVSLFFPIFCTHFCCAFLQAITSSVWLMALSTLTTRLICIARYADLCCCAVVCQWRFCRSLVCMQMCRRLLITSLTFWPLLLDRWCVFPSVCCAMPKVECLWVVCVVCLAVSAWSWTFSIVCRDRVSGVCVFCNNSFVPFDFPFEIWSSVITNYTNFKHRSNSKPPPSEHPNRSSLPLILCLLCDFDSKLEFRLRECEWRQFLCTTWQCKHRQSIIQLQ